MNKKDVTVKVPPAEALAPSDEPQRRDVHINVLPAEAGAGAFPIEVKIELDRIGQVLQGMADIQEGTKKGVELNRTAIIVIAAVALIGFVLSVISIRLQLNVIYRKPALSRSIWLKRVFTSAFIPSRRCSSFAKRSFKSFISLS